MEEFLFNPILWGAVIAILVVISIIAFVVSSRRSKEVNELDQYFPEGNLSGKNLEKIPLEKVRRHSIERERRKQKRAKELPERIRPKEGTKVIEEEDQEYIGTSHRATKQGQDKDYPRLRAKKPKKSNRKRPSEETMDTFQEEADLSNEHQTQERSQRLRPRNSVRDETAASKDSTTKRKNYKRNILQQEEEQEEASFQSFQAEGSSQSSSLSRSSRRGKKQANTQQPSESNETGGPPTRLKRSQKHSVEENQEESYSSRTQRYSIKKRFFGSK